jgi:hypothetical protein
LSGTPIIATSAAQHNSQENDGSCKTKYQGQWKKRKRKTGGLWGNESRVKQ